MTNLEIDSQYSMHGISHSLYFGTTSYSLCQDQWRSIWRDSALELSCAWLKIMRKNEFSFRRDPKRTPISPSCRSNAKFTHKTKNTLSQNEFWVMLMNYAQQLYLHNTFFPLYNSNCNSKYAGSEQNLPYCTSFKHQKSILYHTFLLKNPAIIIERNREIITRRISNQLTKHWRREFHKVPFHHPSKEKKGTIRGISRNVTFRPETRSILLINESLLWPVLSRSAGILGLFGMRRHLSAFPRSPTLFPRNSGDRSKIHVTHSVTIL